MFDAFLYSEDFTFCEFSIDYTIHELIEAKLDSVSDKFYSLNKKIIK